VSACNLSSQAWMVRTPSLRPRAPTTGFRSVDRITVAMPADASLASPSPSPRQHRTASRPSSNTYTWLSVRTPSKSKATRRVSASLRASAPSSIRQILELQAFVLVKRPPRNLPEHPIQLVRRQAVVRRLDRDVLGREPVTCRQASGGD